MQQGIIVMEMANHCCCQLRTATGHCRWLHTAGGHIQHAGAVSITCQQLAAQHFQGSMQQGHNTARQVPHHPASKSIQFCAMRLSVCSLLLMCTLIAPRVDVLRNCPSLGVKSSRYLHRTQQQAKKHTRHVGADAVSVHMLRQVLDSDVWTHRQPTNIPADAASLSLADCLPHMLTADLLKLLLLLQVSYHPAHTSAVAGPSTWSAA